MCQRTWKLGGVGINYPQLGGCGGSPPAVVVLIVAKRVFVNNVMFALVCARYFYNASHWGGGSYDSIVQARSQDIAQEGGTPDHGG